MPLCWFCHWGNQANSGDLKFTQQSVAEEESNSRYGRHFFLCIFAFKMVDFQHMFLELLIKVSKITQSRLLDDLFYSTKDNMEVRMIEMYQNFASNT